MTSSKTKPTAKSDKPTLFLVHGLRGSHHGLRHVADQLKDRYHIINLDLPGSGSAPALENPCLDSYIEYLHETISKLPSRPIVVAHSMGSIIASHYVTKYPDDTDERLVLMSPIFRTKGQKRGSKALDTTLRGVLAPLRPKTKKKLLASKPVSYILSHVLTYDKSMQKQIDQEHLTYSGRFDSAKSLMADIRLSNSYTATLPEGKKILIITGARDPLTSRKIMKQAAAKKSATYHELESTGHLINYERPAEVARLIDNFIKQS